MIALADVPRPEQQAELLQRLAWFEEQVHLSQQQRFGSSREATSLLQLPLFPDDPTAARRLGRARGLAPQKTARPPIGPAGGWIFTTPAASHGGRDSLHLPDLSSTMKLVIEIIPAQRIAHR